MNTHKLNLPASLVFYDHWQSPQAGAYEITLDLQMSASGDRGFSETESSSFSSEVSVYVAGERFSLATSEIASVFPTDGSRGDHSNVLPHVVLHKCSLPWQRRADDINSRHPWLALLLFDESERPAIKSVRASQLVAAGSHAQYPVQTLEPAQHADDLVQVIDVPRSLLEKILPQAGDLDLLAHVRQGRDQEGNAQNPSAVVVANRLPQAGKHSTVHLVSVEGRYPDGNFDYGDAGAEDRIRLVSLFHWTFSCENKHGTFRRSFQQVDAGPLRLNKQAAGAEALIEAGAVPLLHDLRSGKKTASWYHGPCSAGKALVQLPIPALNPDSLLIYDPETGMLDISYAAAWELGRFLALESKSFALELDSWKRAHRQRSQYLERRDSHPEIPLQAPSEPDLSDTVKDKLDQWARLEGIPFRYLVADADLLPEESLRFFKLDETWMECLLDGVFSLGHAMAPTAYQASLREEVLKGRIQKASGCLLRSKLLGQFPGLMAEAFSQKQGLQLLHGERVAEDVYLWIFAGEMDEMAFHLHPEHWHWGLERDVTQSGVWIKAPRNPQNPKSLGTAKAVSFRGQDPEKAVDMVALAQALGTTGSGPFAYSMMAQPINIRFQLKKTN